MRIDSYCRIGTVEPDCLVPEELLRQMDCTFVDKAAISAHERYQAVDNRDGNTYIIRTAGQHPDRFIPTCSINPWYGDRALSELRRCRESGVKLIILNPACQGFMIDDLNLVGPVAGLAEELAMTIYVHTPIGATPLQLSLTARQFPSVNWIMGHCGATDYWYDVPAAVRSSENIYIESSFSRPFTFFQHCKNVGFDRGIMGSGAPLTGHVFEWQEMEQVFSPDDDVNFGIYGETLARLLGEKNAGVPRTEPSGKQRSKHADKARGGRYDL